MISCPLCFNVVFTSEIKGPSGQWFHYCENCRLVFSEKQDLPNRQNEKERYLEHENSIHDKGYVRHLNQAINPALPYLRENMRGLDYGCGPAPTLNRLLAIKGLNCEFYDPSFFLNILWVGMILFLQPNASNIFSGPMRSFTN